MDPQMLQSHPLFRNLITKLNEKLSDQNSSPKVQKAFDQAQRQLLKCRSEWLAYRILYIELQEVLTDLDVSWQENTLTSDEEKLKDVLASTLAHAELRDYLSFSPSAASTSTLFGLSAEDIDRHNPVKAHLPDLLRVVIPRLEAKLNQKCEDLYAFFNPSENHVSSQQLLAAKGHSLPGLVEERREHLARQRTKLEETRAARDSQFWNYFQKILECLRCMETLIKDYKCGHQSETDKTMVHYLLASAEATCLKLWRGQLSLMCETYSAETMKALRVVNNHLDVATSKAKRDLSATTHSLDAYTRLGPEFESLASQVNQLHRELNNKRWGLQQFGRDHPEPQVSEVRDHSSSDPGQQYEQSSQPISASASVTRASAKAGDLEPSVKGSEGESMLALSDSVASLAFSDTRSLATTEKGKKVTFE